MVFHRVEGSTECAPAQTRRRVVSAACRLGGAARRRRAAASWRDGVPPVSAKSSPLPRRRSPVTQRLVRSGARRRRYSREAVARVTIMIVSLATMTPDDTGFTIGSAWGNASLAQRGTPLQA